MIPRGRPLSSPPPPPPPPPPPSTLPPPGGARSAARRRVLVVDDEPSVRRSTARLLLERGFEALTAEDGGAALALLATTNVDVLLVDMDMPQMSGIELLERAKKAHPDVEVVVMASLADLDRVPEAARAGAFGFVSKPPVIEDEIPIVVARAADRRALVRRARALEERLGEHERFGEVIGQSSRLREAYRVAMAAASASSPVLILGESGTGKELFARAIHRHGTRADRSLLAIDCGALPEPVIEAELFGAGPGAAPTSGLFERAEKGTVLLDAVSELSLPAQGRLVEALARGGLPRIIATAPADLRQRIASGRFRQDLFYRLAVIAIHLPPLRQRKEDIPLLAYHFLQKHARGADDASARVKKIGVEALRKLREHAWPGNVRELEGAIERAVVMARGESLLPADLPLSPLSDDGSQERAPKPPPLFPPEAFELPYPDAKERFLDAFDKSYIERAMERASGNISEAARGAGMDRSNFRRLLRKVKGGAADRASGAGARRAGGGGAPTSGEEGGTLDED